MGAEKPGAIPSISNLDIDAAPKEALQAIVENIEVRNGTRGTKFSDYLTREEIDKKLEGYQTV